MNILDNPKYSHLLKRQPFYHRIGKTLLYNWARFIFSWYTPLKVYGTENIPSGSFIFSSNHNAHLDVIALSLPNQVLLEAHSSAIGSGLDSVTTSLGICTSSGLGCF